MFHLKYLPKTLKVVKLARPSPFTSLKSHDTRPNHGLVIGNEGCIWAGLNLTLMIVDSW